MIVVKSIDKIQEIVNKITADKKKISLIPTMGNLHEGHLKLFKNVNTNTIKIVSIYVNKLQFDADNDFTSYPRTLEHDIDYCKKNNIDIVFAPIGEIPITNPEKKIDLPKFTNYLCGRNRKGHFEGVYQIIRELFNLIKPTYVCFGKKDFQQLLLINYIVKTYYPEIAIISVDTVRNQKNIALSSRLNRLSNNSIIKAEKIFNSISMIRESLLNNIAFIEAKEKACEYLESSKIEVEYLEHRSLHTLEQSTECLENSGIFIACNIDGVRLIDNIEI